MYFSKLYLLVKKIIKRKNKVDYIKTLWYNSDNFKYKF